MIEIDPKAKEHFLNEIDALETEDQLTPGEADTLINLIDGPLGFMFAETVNAMQSVEDAREMIKPVIAQLRENSEWIATVRNETIGKLVARYRELVSQTDGRFFNHPRNNDWANDAPLNWAFQYVDSENAETATEARTVLLKKTGLTDIEEAVELCRARERQLNDLFRSDSLLRVWASSLIKLPKNPTPGEEQRAGDFISRLVNAWIDLCYDPQSPDLFPSPALISQIWGENFASFHFLEPNRMVLIKTE